jgi:Tfp pilus assembly protein FimT
MGPSRILRDERAFSLVEVLVSCAVVGAVLAVAVPQVLGFQDRSRAAAAARYVAGRLQLARMEALKRSAHVAVGFAHVGDELEFAMYVDGNGNGVRTIEIASRTDPSVSAPERIGHIVPGARFAIVAGTPSIDDTGPLTGTDPVRVGRSNLVSFSPLGGATPGTIYLCGPDRRRWAVRITGATGRVRVCSSSRPASYGRRVDEAHPQRTGAVHGASRPSTRHARDMSPQARSEVNVINLSSAGALVEGPCRLRPGGIVSVSFGLALGGQAMKCLVTRCRVTAIGGTEAVRYQAGLAFEKPLAMIGSSFTRG